jgi:hypothetical protein
MILQNADRQKRQTGQHVEYESAEWEYVFKLLSSLSSLTYLIHKWAAKDKGLLVSVTK